MSRNSHETRPGGPLPLGATWDRQGVNFALFSENATGVELCLYEGPEGSDLFCGERVLAEAPSVVLLRRLQ